MSVKSRSRHIPKKVALKLLEDIRPGLAVLTHFGMSMINAGPEEEAAYLEEETGVPTISASDMMYIIINKNIKIKRLKNDKIRTLNTL